MYLKTSTDVKISTFLEKNVEMGLWITKWTFTFIWNSFALFIVFYLIYITVHYSIEVNIGHICDVGNLTIQIDDNDVLKSYFRLALHINVF